MREFCERVLDSTNWVLTEHDTPETEEAFSHMTNASTRQTWNVNDSHFVLCDILL